MLETHPSKMKQQNQYMSHCIKCGKKLAKEDNGGTVLSDLKNHPQRGTDDNFSFIYTLHKTPRRCKFTSH